MSKDKIASVIGSLCVVGAMMAWIYAGFERAHEGIAEMLANGMTYEFEHNGELWKLLPPKDEG